MKLYHSWNDVAPDGTTEAPLFLVIGAFDGIHIGHQLLIDEAIRLAKEARGKAYLLTFDPHPSRVLRPDQSPPLLTSTAHKIRLLQATGLDGLVVHPFTPELADWTPDTFMETLCAALPGLTTIIVGTNWRFGKKAAGDVHTLRTLADRHGFAVHIPSPEQWAGAPVSSTRIRKAIEDGELDLVAAMLNRPFSLLGTVISGNQFGRTLGFPTANIQLDDEARPPTGVYAVYATVDTVRHNGAAYLGIRPTAHGTHSYHLLEVHLFDISLDLYDKEIEVFFVHPIRPDQRFDHPDELREQIARDVQAARDYFQQRPS